ncbi:S24 family peptidase [Parabacteroides distasonis]|uniref:S24 family peptidase n=1 Tax=Parabacteroides distasonis TaxID=823 RepID=UPI0021AB59E2|nr:S24 family peptidase [Parabacteroides distasonis]
MSEKTLNNKLNGTRGLDIETLQKIILQFESLNVNWLITGKGEMLNPISDTTADKEPVIMREPNITYGQPAQTRPRIPYAAAAGALTSAVEGIMAEQCEQIPRITAFPDYDFTIIIKGNSMEPKYEGGDEVACKRVDSTSFIQWGKVHVMDTAQGIVIKRVYEDGDKIRCVSYNPEYPDFSMEKDEIYSMSLVVGLLRM